MPPRRRTSATPTSTALWLAAAAATSVVAAGLTWWLTSSTSTSSQRNSPDARDRDNTQSRDPAKPSPSRTAALARNPGQSLTLCCRKPPPRFVVERLSSRFKLHIVVPSPSGKPVTSPYDDVTTFDSKRLISHETPTGLVHVTRFLRGTVVFVNGDSVQDDLEQEQHSQKVKWEHVNINKLVRDTRTFVKGTIVMQAQDAQALDDDLVQSVAIVVGWTDLCDQLGA
ncbi:hypothetical protein ACM66B_006665 [Microbotryomycetes sp. NB124-2]